MLAQIDGLPDQLQSAWELGLAQPLPDFKDIQNIVISAMGDSAIAAELVTASVSSSIRLPVTLHRGYGLPAFASGQTDSGHLLFTFRQLRRSIGFI